MRECSTPYTLSPASFSICLLFSFASSEESIPVSVRLGAKCSSGLRLTWVGKRGLVSAENVTRVADVGIWCIGSLLVLPIECVLPAKLLELLAAMLLGLVGCI